METINIKLEDIIPYKNNAKKHDITQINNVAESIKQFGMVQPLVLDKNNEIVIGHCRYEALKKLGEKEAPCVMADDLTEEQIKKLRNLDNKLNESEWDYDLLKFDIEDLDFSGFEVDWEIPDLDFEEKETEDDDFDIELPVEPKSKLGDIYQLGNHRLMCGDSTKIEDVEKLMNGNKADMVFTDPPYGYKYQSNFREKTEKFDVLINDDKILDFIPIIKNINTGFVFVCTAWKVLDKWIPLFKKYYDLSNMIIWDKGGGGLGDLKHTFLTDYEVILCSNNDREITGKRLGSVWSIVKDSANEYIHATQKPVELAATAIKNVTNKNEVVLDVFGGSGSTLIACEQLERKCYMMELDPKYVDVIIERWEQYTCKKAVLLNE